MLWMSTFAMTFLLSMVSGIGSAAQPFLQALGRMLAVLAGQAPGGRGVAATEGVENAAVLGVRLLEGAGHGRLEADVGLARAAQRGRDAADMRVTARSEQLGVEFAVGLEPFAHALRAAAVERVHCIEDGDDARDVFGAPMGGGEPAGVLFDQGAQREH